jgi:hypothetical protein
LCKSVAYKSKEGLLLLRDDFFSMFDPLFVSGDYKVSSFMNHFDQNPEELLGV